MAIEKDPQVLDSAIIEREDPIISAAMVRLFKNLSALYEGALDDTAPGDSVQAFEGHDHARAGGPICRGVSFSEVRNAPAYSITAGAAQERVTIDSDGTIFQKAQAFFYGSPLFVDGVSKLSGRVLYAASGSKWRLLFQEVSGTQQSTKSAIAEVVLEETGETPQWVSIEGIPFAPGQWNNLRIGCENESYDSADPPTLDIYGICIWEQVGITRYSPSLFLSKLDQGQSNVNSTSGKAFVAFESLDTGTVQEEDWLDADSLSRVSWFLNAMFEALTDQQAPGTASQTCKGHDHDDYGGLNITRNLVASMGLGQRTFYTVQVAASGEHGNTTPSTGSAVWHIADRDTSAGAVRSTANVAMMKGPVSPGVSNTGTSTAPYLDAYVYVTGAFASGSTTLRLAIHNRTRAAFSAVGTLSLTASGGGWVYIDQIPATPDQFNEFDLYVQSTAASVTIQIGKIAISESAVVDGAVVSQPTSSGGSALIGRPL